MTTKITSSISWWRHQMETFSPLLTLCAGNLPVDSPHKGQWRGYLVFSLLCAWTNGWVKKTSRRWFETQSRPLWRHCIVICMAMNGRREKTFPCNVFYIGHDLFSHGLKPSLCISRALWNYILCILDSPSWVFTPSIVEPVRGYWLWWA